MSIAYYTFVSIFGNNWEDVMLLGSGSFRVLQMAFKSRFTSLFPSAEWTRESLPWRTLAACSSELKYTAKITTKWIYTIVYIASKAFIFTSFSSFLQMSNLQMSFRQSSFFFSLSLISPEISVGYGQAISLRRPLTSSWKLSGSSMH